MDLTRSTRFWFGLPGKYHKSIYLYILPKQLERAALSPSTSICLRIWIFFFFWRGRAKYYCYKFERLHLMIYKHKSKYSRRPCTIYIFASTFCSRQMYPECAV